MRWPMLALVVVTRAAAAEPAPEPSAADVANAPKPGAESGRTDEAETDSTMRVVGRDVLYVPKLAVDVALTPLRAGVWLHAKYDLFDLYRRWFFNDAYTIGLYPTISFESGFGLDAGARFVHRDLAGQREHLALAASLGTSGRQLYAAELRSGDRLGSRFHTELDLGYERRPNDRYFGIGNTLGMEAYYRQQRARAMILGDVLLFEHVHLRPSAAISDVSFGDSTQHMPIGTVYDPSTLVGFDGLRYAYEELELRWDNRGRMTRWEPRALFTTGWLVGAFGGHVDRLDGGHGFARYGVDLQHFVRIAAGPRVFATRFHGEAVTGSRDDVPFTELPRLGGLTYLRGYAFDQFRDRVAAFGSAEYQWDLAQRFSASVFVDAGRVFPALDQLSLDHMRVGYGVALEAHTEATFVLQGSIASSIDGGIMLNLAFNPVFDIEERVRRR